MEIRKEKRHKFLDEKRAVQLKTIQPCEPNDQLIADFEQNEYWSWDLKKLWRQLFREPNYS